jgi:Tfp pilus assembly protein PilF
MLANQQGDKALAEKQFRDALAVGADLYEVHYSLGLLLAEMQRYPEAAKHLERAAEGMPSYARVHYNLGQMWDFLGEARKARAALERAYALDPQHPDYLKALIRSHVTHERLEALDALADALLRQDPDSSAGRQIRRFVQDAKNKRK